MTVAEDVVRVIRGEIPKNLVNQRGSGENIRINLDEAGKALLIRAGDARLLKGDLSWRETSRADGGRF